MKVRSIAALLSLLAAVPALAECRWRQPGETWGQPDKRKHAIAGALIAGGVGLIARDPWLGLAAAGFASAAKELRDDVAGGVCSGMDAAATFAGAGLATVGVLVIVRPSGAVQVSYLRRF